MAIVKPSAAAQLILDKYQNTPITFVAHNVYELILAAWPYCHEVFSGVTTTLNRADIQAMIDTSATLERKYIDTFAKVHEAELKALENDISTSAKHIAANEKQLWDSIQGIKQDIADIKTHAGHNAQIVDQIENQLMALEAKVKDHTATKHHNQPDPVVYSWDVQPYELNIRTKTSVPAAGHTYEYKYTLNGVEYSINASDAYLKVGTELGTLTYTPLNSGVSKVVIERTS